VSDSTSQVFVGIDVSASKLDLAILPSDFTATHTNDDAGLVVRPS
jgi:hypothetical protein